MTQVAVGVKKIEMGDVGNGIPGASLSEIGDISQGTLAFNFSDPSEYRVMAENKTDPIAIITSKGEADYVEFAIISPSADTKVKLMGGTAKDGGSDTNNDIWEAPVGNVDIHQTVKITTDVYKGKSKEYIIVNGKVVAKLSQAPGKQQEELVLVRVYVEAATTDGGESKTPWIENYLPQA